MTATPTAPTQTQAQGIPWKRVLLWSAVVLTVLFSLGPPLWELLTSVKTTDAITADSVVYFPNFAQLTLDHYIQHFQRHQVPGIVQRSGVPARLLSEIVFSYS